MPPSSSNVLAAPDRQDEATRDQRRPADYTAALDPDGLRGARIGIPSDPADPANDVYYAPLSPRAAAVMRSVIAVLESAGAVLVRANMLTISWMGGPGTDAPILNRNPKSATRNRLEPRPMVYLYELKHDLNAYLRDWAKGTAMRTMADIIAFNAAHADRALRFGQDLLRPRKRRRRPRRSRLCRGAAKRYPRLPHARHRRLYGPIGSTPSCSPAATARRSPPRQAIRACWCRPAWWPAQAGYRRPTIRSAPPSRAAPGARPRSCASPTPSSKPPRPGACPLACRGCRPDAGLVHKAGRGLRCRAIDHRRRRRDARAE